MRRPSRLVGLLAVTLLAAGCTAEADPPAGDPPVVAESSYAGPASLTNPLGAGLLGVDAVALEEALLDRVTVAGGLTAVVTGGSYETVVELDVAAAGGGRGGRRFTWHQGGVDREQLHVAADRVCVNRASNPALRARFAAAMHGKIVLSRRAYSCTPPTMSSGFLGNGLDDLDPLRRVATLDEWSGVDDLGVEAADGVTTRHLRFDGARGSSVDPPVPWDLWLDEDLHLVRVEYDGKVTGASYSATFTYGEVPPIALPPAADRGDIRLVTYPVGSYLGPRGTAPGVTAPRGE